MTSLLQATNPWWRRANRTERELIHEGWATWDDVWMFPGHMKRVIWSGRMICSTTKLDSVLVTPER